MIDSIVVETTIKIDANFIKASVMQYARFKRAWTCCTEFTMYREIADVMILNENSQFIEVEVKISKSDFLADFKKRKHRNAGVMHVHKFYFAVPEAMSEWALEQLKIHGIKQYGLMAIKEWHYWSPENVRIVKKAQPLNLLKPDNDMIKRFNLRICNDLVATKRRFYMEHKENR